MTDQDREESTASRLERWRQIQREVADCAECLQRWRSAVIRPLAEGKIPDPPSTIRILFVGVAPTPQEGKYKGSHFYSSPDDLLRKGLFRVLSQAEFGVSLLGLNLPEGNKVFHDALCFFVHAAKVRPIVEAAPPREVMEFCANRHLRQEILVLRPSSVCFLGLNNASRAATALFGEDFLAPSVRATSTRSTPAPRAS